MQSSIFIDWLTMHQEHPEGGLPRINSGQVFAIDEDGAIEWTTDKAISVDGSYETKLRLRCDGFNIEASGNIGRFRRPDNLFGHTYEQCVEKWNAVLHSFNLPPFTKGEQVFWAGDTHVSWTGAYNTRIDITRNYCLFSREHLALFMSWLASHQKGRLKVGVSPDGGTIDWGQGSKYVYEKFYDKLRQMEHKKYGFKHCDPDVWELVRDNGIGRHELTLKTRFLSQKGFRFLGQTTMGKLIQLYRERSELILTDKVPFDSFNDIPQPYRATAKDWRDGVSLADALHIRKYQRHRRELLKYGIDIATKCNVSALRTEIKQIQCMPLRAPDWYVQRYG